MLPDMGNYFTCLTRSGYTEPFPDPALPGGREGVLIYVKRKNDDVRTDSKED